jgi:xylulokinase
VSIAGLDIGTTGAKAVAFNLDGQVLAGAYREYPMHSPRPGYLELDPNQVLAAAREVVRKVAADVASDPIQSIACSALGEWVVPLDAAGHPLANGIIGFDARGGPACDAFRSRIDGREVFDITGHPINSYHTLFKILHWRENEPEVYRNAAKFCCANDLIAHAMGLEPAIDYALAARTLIFDINTRDWSSRILEVADLPVDRLSRCVAPGEPIGELGDNDFGLPKGCVLAGGLHDQPAGILGAGIGPGESMYATGTVVCLGIRTDRKPDPAVMIPNNLCYYPTFGDGQFVALAWNFTGGSLLRWYRDTLGVDQTARAEQRGVDVFDEILTDLPGEPTDLMVLPHFTTTGTPWMDTQALGAMLGLRLTTTRGEIVRAILEGVTYEVKLNQALLAEAGIDIKLFKAIGGAAKSDLWMQINADILDRPVAVLETTEAASLGTALLGAKAAGLVDSVEQATERVARIGRTFEPDARRARAYQHRFDIYRDIYPATRDLTHRLAALADEST